MFWCFVGQQDSHMANTEEILQSFTNSENNPPALTNVPGYEAPQPNTFDPGEFSDLHIDPLYETARESEVPRHDVEENFKWEVNHLHNFFRRLYADEHHQLR